MKIKSLSRVGLFGTPWTVAYQAPLSVEFLRQEYWSGLPFSPPGDLPDPGIQTECPALQADFLLSEVKSLSRVRLLATPPGFSVHGILLSELPENSDLYHMLI